MRFLGVNLPDEKNMEIALTYIYGIGLPLSRQILREANVDFLKKEMEESYEVLTEAIQIVLRLKKDDEGYEKVKKLVRGKKLQRKDYLQILKVLGLDDNKKLKNLAPESYF